jgi:hypothetical protein
MHKTLAGARQASLMHSRIWCARKACCVAASEEYEEDVQVQAILRLLRRLNVLKKDGGICKMNLNLFAASKGLPEGLSDTTDEEGAST